MKKLNYVLWLSKYFDKDPDHTYWTSRADDGFAPQDKSRWKREDLLEEYKQYSKDPDKWVNEKEWL